MIKIASVQLCRKWCWSRSRAFSTALVDDHVKADKLPVNAGASAGELSSGLFDSSVALNESNNVPLGRSPELLVAGLELVQKGNCSAPKKVGENNELLAGQLKNTDVIINPCGIQMISKCLHDQIFPTQGIGDKVSEETLTRVKDHLVKHDLWQKATSILPNVDIRLPPLVGENIAQHFENIATKQGLPYKEKLQMLIEYEIPEMPSVWNFSPGWTKYDEEGKTCSVEYPDEDAYVFDVEVCVQEGHQPVLATAVSNRYWYSWCSKQLIDEKTKRNIFNGLDPRYTLSDLIPLESKFGQDRLQVREQKERIVVGHNVSYDRSRIKEQYFVEGTKLRFCDTMSMHIAVSGITSYQRNILMAEKSGTKLDRKNKAEAGRKPWKSEEILEWQNVSSFNGLKDVYKLYCGGPDLDKDKRNTFVTGTLSDIKKDFQALATYCAQDTRATHRVLCALVPEFFSRFPHPATFVGMLEMGIAYLPVNRNWQRYLRDSEDTYRELESELTQSLRKEADSACHLMADGLYKKDPWLYDLDWSTQSLKVKKTPKTSPKMLQDSCALELDPEADDTLELQNKFRPLMESRNLLYKKSPFLPGYPAWYRNLCSKDQDGLLGPSDITTSSQVVPKLLKLTWDGYPLFHSRDLGWGYLVPGRPLEYCSQELDAVHAAFPLKEALQLFPPKFVQVSAKTQGIITVEEAINKLQRITSETEDPISMGTLWKATYSERKDEDEQLIKKKVGHETQDRPAWHQGIGPYDVGVPGCWFFRLPHKSGADNNVGNPLAKDYLNKIEDGTLKATSGSIAEHVLKLNRMIIYWRNARDRILSQMVVWLNKTQLPRFMLQAEDYDSSDSYGAILPQVITSGTLTRRAVESTWLTASNAYKNRLGSELKAMIHCHPGYSLVGADVDSQELWIASVIGDAHFAGLHGCTAFGWMTLQGKKSEGTDMHSRTASAVSILRDQAKVLNYGRIYGAGEKFAKTLLLQFNHRLTEEEAVAKARQIYSITKGSSVYQLNSKGVLIAAQLGITRGTTVTQGELNEIRKQLRKNDVANNYRFFSNNELVEKKIWAGGTESHMFNKLEEIAQSELPKTPVLQCQISRALEPRNVGKEFMTSRVNWVVQSSAVDYLHLMLVAMRYLFDTYRIDGRFCISIHDEVRYLVRNDDRFRAALALQITNLWTRSLFSYQLKMFDLPLSVAFFSSIEVDTVLRKEVDMDCQTPSNPYGLKQGYGVPFGEKFDIYEILEKTKGSLQP